MLTFFLFSALVLIISDFRRPCTNELANNGHADDWIFQDLFISFLFAIYVPGGYGQRGLRSI